MMRQLFPFLLLLVSISAFPLDLERNETCDELKKRFMHQFMNAVRTDRLHSTLASHLAIKCRRVLTCEKQGNLSLDLSMSFVATDLPFSEKICKTLDLINGPVGECLDYIRDEYDDEEVIECVRKEKTIDSLKKEKAPSLQSAMSGIFQFDRSCDSLFSNCTKSVITSECSLSVWESLQEHRDLLMSTECAGTEIFAPSKMEFAEALDGMAEERYNEMMKEWGRDKVADKVQETDMEDVDKTDSDYWKKRIEDDEDEYEEEEFGKKKKQGRHSIDDY